jgi:hypothetical protein
MTWNLSRFNLSPDHPGPSLHITAAATSLTSFINVSGQPHFAQALAKTFPGEIIHASAISQFWPIFWGFLVWLIANG